MTWAGVTSLQTEQPCVPRLDCGGAAGPREDGPANESPLHLQSQVHWGWDHHLQIQAGRRTAQPNRVRTQSPVDFMAGRAWIRHQVSKSSDCGFPAAASFLGIPHTPYDSTLSIAVWAVVGILLGLKRKGEAAMRCQPLAVSSGTFHPNLQPGNMTFLWLWLPE